MNAQIDGKYSIYNGDCREEMKRLKPNCVDVIITDPPYELNFMGKGWDKVGVSFSEETWKKCLRVLKPGGYLLAFGGTRTYHRIACAIEDAGFEIRDCIMWLYGSGFPKNMNIGLAIDKKLGNESKIIGEGRSGGNSRACQSAETTTAGAYQLKEAQNEWAGWGTALKPSYEPIIVARKPFKGSLVDNVMKYGVGGINIDECRVATTDTYSYPNGGGGSSFGIGKGIDGTRTKPTENNPLGRFPANTILDTNEGEEWRRYFYCAKASKKDRDEGLDEYEEKTSGQLTERKEGSAGITAFAGSRSPKRNTHPTVKPTTLMQYLIRLVAPKGATILDPFMGSGSTGKAVMYENKERNADYKFIGIEKETEYYKIAQARIEYAKGAFYHDC
jgi:site-specific DNA-methyltransferase (adenine-specific)